MPSQPVTQGTPWEMAERKRRADAAAQAERDAQKGALGSWDGSNQPAGATTATTFGAVGTLATPERAAQIPAGGESHAQDVSQARNTNRSLLDQYNRTQPRTAPQATATSAVAPAPVSASQIAPAAQSTASQVVAPGAVSAPTINPTQQVQAQQVGGSRIGNIERYGASQIAPTERANFATANAAAVARAEESQMRQKQLGLLQGLEGVAAGTAGPSVAEIQLQRATQANIQNQAGLAAGARGGNIVSARRQAVQQQGAIGQQAASDNALLRATEIERARGQLLSGYSDTRGQDIGLATTDAGFRQGANLQNAQAATQTSQFNAGQSNARAMSQAQLEQQAAAGNANAQNEMARRQAEIDQQANLSNQDANLRAGIANQGVDAQRNLAGAEMGLRAGLANQSTALSAGTTNANLESEASRFNAGQTNTVNTSNATLAQQATLANLDNQTKVLLQNADNQTKVAVANMDASLRQQGLDDAERSRLIQQYLQGQGQVLGWDAANQGSSVSAMDRFAQFAGPLAQVGAAAVTKSDRRSKTDVKPLYSDKRGKLLSDYDESSDEIGDLLSKLVPSKFRYKDPDSDGAAKGERIGIMAQDLEKSPAGKALVLNDGGVKKIDTGQAVGVLLAAMAKMHDRVKRMEKR